MTRLALHVRTDQELIADPEGYDLPDLSAAEREALLALRQLAADRLRSGRPLDVQQIEIANGAGQHCQLVGSRDARCRAAMRRATSRCHLDARLLLPHLESLGTSMPVLTSGQQMSPWTEMPVDHGVQVARASIGNGLVIIGMPVSRKPFAKNATIANAPP